MSDEKKTIGCDDGFHLGCEHVERNPGDVIRDPRADDGTLTHIHVVFVNGNGAIYKIDDPDASAVAIAEFSDMGNRAFTLLLDGGGTVSFNSSMVQQVERITETEAAARISRSQELQEKAEQERQRQASAIANIARVPPGARLR